jgi:hypothetical protein
VSSPPFTQPRLMHCPDCGGWHYVLGVTPAAGRACDLCERQARHLLLGVVHLCSVHFRAVMRDLVRVPR